MYRSQADRMAEAARAQQITEQRIQEIRAKQPAVTTEQFGKKEVDTHYSDVILYIS